MSDKIEAQNVVHAQNVTIVNNYGNDSQPPLDKTIEQQSEEIAPGISQGLRAPLAKFAVAMEKKLSDRDVKHPYGWSKDTQDALIKRLADKYGEFLEVLHSDVATGRILELGVDTANYVMMLTDNAGGLNIG